MTLDQQIRDVAKGTRRTWAALFLLLALTIALYAHRIDWQGFVLILLGFFIAEQVVRIRERLDAMRDPE